MHGSLKKILNVRERVKLNENRWIVFWVLFVCNLLKSITKNKFNFTIL